MTGVSFGPDPRLWAAQAPASRPSRGDPPGRPRLATSASHLGGRTDPRVARRGPAPGRLAQLAGDPTLVPGRRVGTRPPAGRRAAASTSRAEKPHQTWQIDASEHIRLADGAEVCWLRILDEATGAVLRTDVFPPRLLDSGRPSRHAERHVEAESFRRWGLPERLQGRQRLALGVAGRPAHRPGLLAGGGRRRGDGQSDRDVRRPMAWWSGGKASASSGASPGRAPRTPSCDDAWRRWTGYSGRSIRSGGGQSRLAAHPGLEHSGRAFDPASRRNRSGTSRRSGT